MASVPYGGNFQTFVEGRLTTDDPSSSLLWQEANTQFQLSPMYPDAVGMHAQSPWATGTQA